MQFLESSVIGLRAARHRLRAPDHPAEVTLYPMIHVGEAAYFDQVSREALDLDVVLVEGVRTRSTWFLTRAYHWLPLSRLGLVTQPPIPRRAGGPEIVLADLGADEFETLWRALPAWLRAGMTLASPAYGGWLRLTASRDSIARRQSTSDLPDRDIALAHGDPDGRLLDVILHARDAALTQALARELDADRTVPRRIAVVYGALHMPAVVRELGRHGRFRPVDSTWLDAIRL